MCGVLKRYDFDDYSNDFLIQFVNLLYHGFGKSQGTITKHVRIDVYNLATDNGYFLYRERRKRRIAALKIGTK